MKTIIIALSTILYISASAQGVVVQSGAEKAVSGTQFGTSLSAETKKLWSLGVFYQAGINRQIPENNTLIKNPFYGLLLQAPILKSERIVFFANLRVGLVNEKFLVIVPSVETRMHLTKRAGISIGSGIRMGYPSVYGKLFAKLF